MKPHKISLAVFYLWKYDLREKGLLSCEDHPVYGGQHCRDIIDHSTDEEIVALGLDVGEARSLARRNGVATNS